MTSGCCGQKVPEATCGGRWRCASLTDSFNALETAYHDARIRGLVKISRIRPLRKLAATEKLSR